MNTLVKFEYSPIERLNKIAELLAEAALESVNITTGLPFYLKHTISTATIKITATDLKLLSQRYVNKEDKQNRNGIMIVGNRGSGNE